MILRLILLSLFLTFSLSTRTTKLTSDAFVQEIREYLNHQSSNENLKNTALITDDGITKLAETVRLQNSETEKPRQTRFNAETTANNLEVANKCSGNEIHAIGKVEVSERLETIFFNAEELHLNRLNVKSLYNPHNAIILRGNLKLASLKTNQPLNTSSFLVKGVKQWNLLSHETFNEKDKIEGWSLAEIGSCGKSQVEQKFLGGHCLLNTEVTKDFKSIPPHQKLRITGTVHLFDKWEGEKIFLEMDGGQIIWKKIGAVNNKFETLDRCGNSNYGDPLMNLKIDKIIDHQDSTLSLKFNTNMKKNSCEASYGIADFAIYYQ